MCLQYDVMILRLFSFLYIHSQEIGITLGKTVVVTQGRNVRVWTSVKDETICTQVKD